SLTLLVVLAPISAKSQLHRLVLRHRRHPTPSLFPYTTLFRSVLPQLDINNNIDHRPEGDEKWFLENEKTVTQFCRKLAAERPLKIGRAVQQECRDRYRMPSSA